MCLARMAGSWPSMLVMRRPKTFNTSWGEQNGMPMEFAMICVFAAVLQLADSWLESFGSRSGGDGSEFVQHSVSVCFSRFQSIAEIQELILRRTTVHLVDGPTHVSDQLLEFKTVHRHDFDVMTCRTGLQGMFNLFEWISISRQQ